MGTSSERALAGAVAILALILAPSRPAQAGGGSNLCKAASAEAVGKALHATIVRAKAPESEAGCEYSASSSPADATSSHALAMTSGMTGTPMDPQAAKAFSAFSNAMLGGASAQQGGHPEEIPVLVFSVSTGDARNEMKINRDTLGRMSPITPVPGLGDDAFETSGSGLMVRKGDKFIRFIYTQCNCASKDVIPLARQIVAGLQ